MFEGKIEFGGKENKNDNKEATLRSEAYFRPGSLGEDVSEEEVEDLTKNLNEFIKSAPVGKILEYMNNLIVWEDSNRLFKIDRLLNSMGYGFDTLKMVDPKSEKIVVGLIKVCINGSLGAAEIAPYKKDLADILDS